MAGKQTIALLGGQISFDAATRLSRQISKVRIHMMDARKTHPLAAILVLTSMALGIIRASAQERPAEQIPLFKLDRSTTGLAFSPDGQKLACDLVLADLNGKEVAKSEVDEDCPHSVHVAFSRDGKWLASVHFDDGRIQARHAICLWNVTADNKLQKPATLQLTKETNLRYKESL
jgi:hypothetical protein